MILTRKINYGHGSISKKWMKVYKVGCLGKISDYKKSEDGRILINLTGITRFKILEEIKNKKLYREFKVDYANFEIDLKVYIRNEIQKTLMEKAKIFLKEMGYY